MARTAKEVAISYTFGFNSRIGDINAVLVYYGYKKLPDHIAEAIEEIKALHKEARELAKKLYELQGAKRRNGGWLPSHCESCGGKYQERLELSCEIRNTMDRLSELYAKLARLKSIAKL